MSASEPESKIDFDDDDKTIRSKIMGAFSVDGNPENNGVLAILRYVLWRRLPGKFTVVRPEKYGGTNEFGSYQEVEDVFASRQLSSIDLKAAVAELLVNFLRPLRKKLNKHADAMNKAYPKTERGH